MKRVAGMNPLFAPFGLGERKRAFLVRLSAPNGYRQRPGHPSRHRLGVGPAGGHTASEVPSPPGERREEAEA